jgi:hypothetical protein
MMPENVFSARMGRPQMPQIPQGAPGMQAPNFAMPRMQSPMGPGMSAPIQAQVPGMMPQYPGMMPHPYGGPGMQVQQLQAPQNMLAPRMQAY